MKSFRENPDGEENQRATRETDRYIGGLTLQAKYGDIHTPADKKLEIRQLLTRGIVGLRNAPWHDMTTEDRLLHACLCAYRKMVSSNTNLGWDETGDILFNALCEALGDEGFKEWNDAEWEDEP